MSSQPNFGKRLALALIDVRAEANPARVYCYIPLSKDASDGFLEVSYGKMSNAINFCSTWIFKQLGYGGGKKLVAYFGPQDIRYRVFQFACMKTGWIVSLRFID